MKTTLLEATGLGKEYGGRPVLKGVDLRLERGESFALIGPTGAGKTTLIRLLDLLEAPGAGSIHFAGEDVTRGRAQRFAARRRMALVQQRPALFHRSVFDNVACGLRWRGEPRDRTRRQAGLALEMVGLGHLAGRDAHTLSGGEMQRVAIARALVTRPDLLLLDEPTANLDPVTTAQIEEALAEVVRRGDMALLMATHNMAQGQRLAGRVGVLLEGRMVQAGSPSDIFCSPATTEVASFVGVENILPGAVAAREEGLLTVAVAGHHLQAVAAHAGGDSVWVLLRPEDITLSVAPASGSAMNTLPGIVTRLAPLGPLTRVALDCGFPLLAVVTTVAAHDLGLEAGRPVTASFKATAIQVIPRLAG